ncbi:MAG TPA: hypothetical protein VGB85_04540 [Nannocystis sp.]
MSDPPPAPVIDPREAYIERRLRERNREPEPMLEEEPEEEEDEADRNDGGPPRGVSLIVPGAVLVGAGFVFTGLGFAVRSLSSGGFCIDNCEENASEAPALSGAVAFTFAALSVAAGTGLLVVGGRRQEEWRAWKARQPPPPPPPSSSDESTPRRGIGMMVSGAAVLVQGTSFSLMVFSADSAVGRTFAGLSAVTGITLLALGARRHVKYKRWRDNQTLVPTAGRTAHGTWVAGVALRF